MNIDQVREILTKEGDVAIALSGNYNFDELAAALSLYLVLKNSGRNVQVLSSKQPLVEDSNLFAIDKLNSQYQGKRGDLTVSFPYQEGEIEKISYTMENGLLNIVVKASEQGISFSEKDIKYLRSGEAPAILFTVGVGNLSDLNGLLDANALSGTNTININNRDNSSFGNVVLSSPDASSVSEEVADLLYGLGFRFDPDISQNLLSGIISATNNFQNSKTSGLAFEMAGILIRNGAQRKPQVQNQSQRQNFPKPNQQNQQNQQRSQIPAQSQPKNPPADWLAPKIFKGSTNIE